MFTLRNGRVGMLAAGSMIIAGLGATGALAAGTPNADSMVVRDGAQWYTQAYENCDTCEYTDPEQSDVAGPQRAPFGPGSHKFTIGQYAAQTELYRTNAYDGVDLGDLTRFEYSTFARHTNGGEDRQPAYLRLSVDDDNNGSMDTSLFFFPANNDAQQDVVNGAWQHWDVAGGLMNVDSDSGAGEISLADYAAAHPDAVLVNDPYDEDARRRRGLADDRCLGERADPRRVLRRPRDRRQRRAGHAVRLRSQRRGRRRHHAAHRRPRPRAGLAAPGLRGRALPGLQPGVRLRPRHPAER